MSSDESDLGEGWLIAVYTVFGVAIPLYFGLVVSDWVTAGACLFLCFTSYAGFRMGAVRMLALAVGCVAAYWGARPFGSWFELPIAENLGLHGMVNRAICAGTAGLVILLSTFIVLDTILSRARDRSFVFDIFDRWLGFLAGTAKGLGVTGVLIGSMLVLQPIVESNSKIKAGSSENQDWLVQMTRWGAESTIGTFLRGSGLIRSNPVMQQFDKALVVVSDPQGLKELMEDPRISQLSDRPAVKRTIELVQNDPDLSKMLGEQGEMSQELLLGLARHPAMLKIVDETNLLSELSEVAKEFEPVLDEVSSKIRRKNETQPSPQTTP